MRVVLVAAALVLLAAAQAHAEPYRLRADALASVQAPAGLLVLSGQGRPRTWIDAEAVVWTGLSSPDDSLEAAGDALVVVVRVREPKGRGELTAGRFVVSPGAVRPLHIDGGSARANLPYGIRLEAFGGMPVVPAFGPRAYDWAVGGRIGESFHDILGGGVSYMQRREHGGLADEEAGVDLSLAPARWLDLAARGSYDLLSPGVSEAHLSAATRQGQVRGELFATHRSPSRLLPATSIFSALGDIPSDQLGLTGKWLAAPRLDLFGSLAARWAGGELGGEASLRATLRLDDVGHGAVSAEARRTTVVAPWSGLRLAVRVPLEEGLHAAAELELAFPDSSQGRGAVWPWALAAVGWRFARGWETAAAVEANASPQHTSEVTALVRLGTVWVSAGEVSP